MVVEIKSKDELQAVAGKFKNVSSQLTTESASIIGNLLQTEDFDGINISQAATTIQNNLKNVAGETESLSSSLNNYITDIKSMDTYDFKVDGKVQDNSSQRNNTSSAYLNEKNDDSDSERKTTPVAQEPVFLFESADFSSNTLSNDNDEAENNELELEDEFEDFIDDFDYDLKDEDYEDIELDF